MTVSKCLFGHRPPLNTHTVHIVSESNNNLNYSIINNHATNVYFNHTYGNNSVSFTQIGWYIDNMSKHIYALLLSQMPVKNMTTSKKISQIIHKINILAR